MVQRERFPNHRERVNAREVRTAAGMRGSGGALRTITESERAARTQTGGNTSSTHNFAYKKGGCHPALCPYH